MIGILKFFIIEITYLKLANIDEYLASFKYVISIIKNFSIPII